MSVEDAAPMRPGGTNGFKRRDTPSAERELKRVQAKVGELTMKLDIVEWLRSV